MRENGRPEKKKNRRLIVDRESLRSNLNQGLRRYDGNDTIRVFGSGPWLSNIHISVPIQEGLREHYLKS